MGDASDTRIRILRLSHMRYSFSDLEKTHQFLLDFGMEHIATEGSKRYYSGQGPDPYCYIAQEGDDEFLGGAFLLESKAELERAAQVIPGASQVHSYDGPSGGYAVTFKDPDGFPTTLVWGLTDKKPKLDEEAIPDVNFPNPKQKPRKGQFRRFEQGPCPVYKLGHYGLLVSNFDQTYNFYRQYLNLKATDVLTAPDGKYVAAFLHVDREEEYVDHHTFFFSENSQHLGVHHCSFEVHDPDVQAIGHDWLEHKGYELSWGVGRHILGSQVFDYWYMPGPAGKIRQIEHYSDGDLVNCHNETGYLPAADEALAIWGPAVPAGFMDAIPDSQLPTNAASHEIQAVA